MAHSYELDGKLSVLEWATQRYENTIRLAREKTGATRAGWLEDAAYWRAIVTLIAAAQKLKDRKEKDR